MRRRIVIHCLTAALAAAVSASSSAAPLSPAALADLKRAYAASALASSEAATVREERGLREPSPGFLLGAALGAWNAAREELAYDLANPQAAGAPHATQGPADLDAIDQACREERTAFALLEARARALDLEPVGTVPDADAWRARREQAPAC